MPRHKRRLSDPELRRLRPPREGRAEIGDTVVPGLVVRVTPRGVKSFSVIYKVPGEGGVSAGGRPRAGRQHRVTLGQYPAVSLKRAREQARDLLETVSEGRDPRPERREQNLIRLANTVEAVARRFVEQDAKRTVASWQKIERTLALHVLPGLGDWPIRDVRRADVHELLDGLVAAGRVGAAREVRKHLSRLFNWAVDREIVADNPLHGMERRDLAPNSEAGRALADHELRAIWAASGEMGYPFGPMYRLLMLTGQRRGEWAGASRSEIDTGARALEVPAARHKSGRDHIVPLAGPAWGIVEGLPVWTGGDYYILSTRAGRAPVSGFSKAKTRLDELALSELQEVSADAELAAWRVHDLRVTCETRLADLGHSREVRDAVLGHAKPGLQRTYNKHDYVEEKRAALAAYADHIMAVVS